MLSKTGQKLVELDRERARYRHSSLDYPAALHLDNLAADLLIVDWFTLYPRSAIYNSSPEEAVARVKAELERRYGPAAPPGCNHPAQWRKARRRSSQDRT